ncbi:MAG: hypothetical protein WAM14_03875 [Candidatus Nitrosopolaris sp.]
MKNSNCENHWFARTIQSIFYEQIKRSSWLTDFTNWIQLPPPGFEISTSPTSVDICQGFEKTIIVQIKSTTAFQPTIYLYTDNQKYAKFNHNKIHVPSGLGGGVRCI